MVNRITKRILAGSMNIEYDQVAYQLNAQISYFSLMLMREIRKYFFLYFFVSS